MFLLTGGGGGTFLDGTVVGIYLYSDCANGYTEEMGSAGLGEVCFEGT